MTLGLRQLRYFIAIVDAGALSRASETLSIAQSALSHHVAELEAELGVKLLERRARGVVATAPGRRLYEHASAILIALGKAEIDVKTFTEVASGPVSVGLSHTAIEVMSLELMQLARKSCPDVLLTIVEGLSSNLIEQTLAGGLDFAVAYNPPKDSRLDCRPVLEEDLYLVGRPEIIGRSRAPIAFADIPQGEVLGLNTVQASRAIIQSQILRNQITPSATLELDSLNAMRKALKAGLGCSILARSTVASELLQGSIHARRIVKPELKRTMNIVCLADRPRTRAFTAIQDVLKQVIGAVVQAGQWPARLIERKRAG